MPHQPPTPHKPREDGDEEISSAIRQDIAQPAKILYSHPATWASTSIQNGFPKLEASATYPGLYNAAPLMNSLIHDQPGFPQLEASATYPGLDNAEMSSSVLGPVSIWSERPLIQAQELGTALTSHTSSTLAPLEADYICELVMMGRWRLLKEYMIIHRQWIGGCCSKALAGDSGLGALHRTIIRALLSICSCTSDFQKFISLTNEYERFRAQQESLKDLDCALEVLLLRQSLEKMFGLL